MSIVVNNWRMDPSLNALIHCETGETRRLGEYHFILLETFAKNADAVLSRSWLMAEVWKNRIVGGNSLPTAIHALRAAIDDDGKQQEIIKTIPKKGYIFNKNYLTSICSQPEISAKEDPHDEDPLDTASSVVDVQERVPDRASQTLTSPRKTYRYRATMIVAAIAITAFMLFTLIYFLKVPDAPLPPDTPQLVKENLQNANRIEAWHLYTSTPNTKAIPLLSQHMSPGIAKVNGLLAAHLATMTLYYKVSFNRFTLDIVLSGQCDKSRQLALNFGNWQNKDNEMNNVMYQEVEKMLNEMPNCN